MNKDSLLSANETRLILEYAILGAKAEAKNRLDKIRADKRTKEPSYKRLQQHARETVHEMPGHVLDYIIDGRMRIQETYR